MRHRINNYTHGIQYILVILLLFIPKNKCQEDDFSSTNGFLSGEIDEGDVDFDESGNFDESQISGESGNVENGNCKWSIFEGHEIRGDVSCPIGKRCLDVSSCGNSTELVINKLYRLPNHN